MQITCHIVNQFTESSPAYIIKVHLSNYFNSMTVLTNVILDKRLTNTNSSVAFRRLYLNLCATYGNDIVDAAIRDTKLQTKCRKLLKSA
jgi:hypothetical protein